MGLYDSLAGLELEVGSYELDRMELEVSSGFTRVTSLVRLRGTGEEGVGEDVTYTAGDHPPPADRPLAGKHTVDSFSGLLDGLELFVREPQMAASRDYRRWAFESAAVDLALQQAARPFASAVARDPAPVTFVVSMRLGDPPTTEQVRGWLEHYPGLR